MKKIQKLTMQEGEPKENMDVERDQLMAASIGNMDWLQLCMTASDSQVQADRYAESERLHPLHRAASEGLEDCIAILVDAGANVHAERDSEGNKPIDLCHLRCRRFPPVFPHDGRPPPCRYLRSAMWKKDKKDFAREMKKLEKIKQNIEESEEDAILQMQIPCCDCPKTKNMTGRVEQD
ncbi:unnamed protein product [Ranitomeya imitator]|uniref:Uncharacterized protein n=1 Tax=Ranitomeya imitator TaxID=111125 RepID=A0ABN9L808_9NEOB|nr:unnamed protein product [Ranitomeya imitator]